VSSNVTTDIPALPMSLNEEELEGMILSKFANKEDRIKIRELYSKSNKNYSLKQSTIDIAIFELFTRSHFNLNQYENSFRELKSKQEELVKTNIELINTTDILNIRKGFSYVWFVDDYRIDWTKGVKSSLIDLTVDTFRIEFQIPKDINQFPKLAWNVAANVYCKVKIDKISIVSKEKEIFIDLNFITSNGILDKDGWIEFLRLNNLIYIPISSEIEKITFLGEWEIFQYWQLGNRFQEIKEQTESEVKKITSSRLYKYMGWFVRKISLIKNIFRRN